MTSSRPGFHPRGRRAPPPPAASTPTPAPAGAPSTAPAQAADAPRATVRLQFHEGYTLDDAISQVPYFARLGISHIYASPLTRARPGSAHGYDVVDHGQVNPELGGEAALRRLVQALRAHDMGLIVDIVPNHMATSADNPWWWSVLRDGRASPHATWFDIDWEPADAGLHGKVLAPFLGKPYGASLNDGDIRLRLGDAGWYVDAAGAPYPLADGSLDASLPDPARAYDPATPAGRERLHELLERQAYRLAWWRSAADEINWRRFFEITDLIGVRVEQPAVFDAVHAMVLRLYEEGLVDGLRVDHVDGLADPIAYCARLRAELDARSARRPGALAGQPPYLIVEKILGSDEVLDERWEVDGTTGYDFMDQVGAVLHDAAGVGPITDLWETLAGDTRSFPEIADEARELMLLRHFPAERYATARALHRVATLDPMTRDWGQAAILRVLWQLLRAFPVYRTYADARGRHPLDQLRFDAAAATAHARIRADRDGDDGPLLEAMSDWLGGQPLHGLPPEQSAARELATRRFQQLTPPLTAKSLEDTAFYRYGRLLSRNEVGADPAVFHMAVEAFHRRCAARARRLPKAMVTTATHDHKRGEDTRARIAALSEFAEEWRGFAQDWMHAHAPTTYNGNGQLAPHPADLYMLLQTLVGAWPPDLRPDDGPGLQAYAARVGAWMLKALREAKTRTSWVVPDENYERSCATALEDLMQPGAADDVAAFAHRIAAAGAVNSLSQTLLRLTVPGVPDLYQGTEFWDFSLVDPDNRRPVDYAARAAALDARDAGDIEGLLAGWRDGRIKQAVIHGALEARRARPALYAQGSHVPLPVLGPRGDHIIAFVRSLGDQHAFVLAPRVVGRHLRADDGDADDDARAGLCVPRIDPAFWETTAVVLPHRYAGAVLRDALSGRERRVGADSILPLAEALADFPVALLTGD
ncbi:malto-oligosyltrehalose synthase [Achromobacter aloeverae]|uniref:Malto-oligosyltrehalose synthase n=1 Tax=Achromobacter aloeverae TaxID=1750518 RepID=A0A4V1MSE8_9BURK|nr:malto-oligosyltrehalose synthase [Achromobacter aloeverae]RXN91329.1 malto-oligosyltrehalose synthase [Achromobacter aloeverae]